MILGDLDKVPWCLVLVFSFAEAGIGVRGQRLVCSVLKESVALAYVPQETSYMENSN